MTREEKERVEALRQLNVEILGLRTSGKHKVAKCRAANGREFSIGLAGSSDDRRGLKNFKTDVRKCIERQFGP